MPRPKKIGAPEPKKRSRSGCWPCKNRKVKCDEGHPQCDNCQKASTACDYSVRLNWLGDGNYRPTKKRRPGDTDLYSATPSTSLSSRSPLCDGSNGIRFHVPELLPTHRTPPADRELRPLVPADDNTPTSLLFGPILKELCLSSTSHAATPKSLTNDFQASLALDPNVLLTLSRRHSPDLPQPDSFDGSKKCQGPERKGLSLETTETQEVPADNASNNEDVLLSPQPSRTPARYEVTPANSESLAGAPPWSPSSASMSASPGVRPFLQSAFSLPSAPSPLTSVSTPGGEDEQRCVPSTTPYLKSPSDIRRLSVQSLLTSHRDSWPAVRSFPGAHRGSDHVRAASPELATFYGYDNGKPDKDIGQNDDSQSIVGYSPMNPKGGQEPTCGDMSKESHPADFGLGIREAGNYYAKRVEVWISKELEPLPPKLRQNPMNLLYFHHFLNHTARVLVPHDDPQSNPFRTVLPQMAVKHDNLLSLLLAYSASHRARHLKYPEPGLRIAHLVQGVIADLRSLTQQSIDNPGTVISTADAATSIMLASLEIISPAAIGGSIPWHHHLNIARELISRMPDGLRPFQPTTQEHCVRSFLWSWFAYLDVLGSLSGGPATLLTPSCYTTGGPLSPADPHIDSSLSHIDERRTRDDDMGRIDCILGFTPRCVFILARIAELARHCEEARLRSPSWRPDGATRAAAAALEMAALRSLAAPSRPCGHVHGPSPLRRWDRTQMAAANRAFHHAALIHLHRRVLGKGSAHPDVKGAGQSVLECLEHVEPGSSAELCLLFPMFTAGCELVDTGERAAILERVVSVERTGMMQVYRARRLMQKVWETGQPWETLVDAEFIG